MGVVALSEIPPRATDRESSSGDRRRERVLVPGATKGVLLARQREGPCRHIDRERVIVRRPTLRGSLSGYRPRGSSSRDGPWEARCRHIDRERVLVPGPRVRGSLSGYATKEGHRAGTDGERLHVAIATERVLVRRPRVRGSLSRYLPRDRIILRAQTVRGSMSPYRAREGHRPQTEGESVLVAISTERGSSSGDWGWEGPCRDIDREGNRPPTEGERVLVPISNERVIVPGQTVRRSMSPYGPREGHRRGTDGEKVHVTILNEIGSSRGWEGPCPHIDRKRVIVRGQLVIVSVSPYRPREGHGAATEGERVLVPISNERGSSSRDRGEIGHIEGEMVIFSGPRVRGSMSPYRAKQGPRTSLSPYRTKEGHCRGTDRHMVHVPISTERGSSSGDRSWEGPCRDIKGERVIVPGERVIVPGPTVRGSMSPWECACPHIERKRVIVRGPTVRGSISSHRRKMVHIAIDIVIDIAIDIHIVYDIAISTERGSSSRDRGWEGPCPDIDREGPRPPTHDERLLVPISKERGSWSPDPPWRVSMSAYWPRGSSEVVPRPTMRASLSAYRPRGSSSRDRPWRVRVAISTPRVVVPGPNLKWSSSGISNERGSSSGDGP